MKKYIWAFLITIPILLLVWNIDDSAEEPKITYSDTVEENRGHLASIMEGTDDREGIRPEEIEDMDEESGNEELLTQILTEHLQNNDFSGITFREPELVYSEGGTFREILSITLRIINYEATDNHEALTVLDEKTDGFYAIVTPFYNHILRYDKEKDWYEFHDGE